MNRLFLSAVFLTVWLAGCQHVSEPPASPAEADGPDWFEDATDKLGIDFVHDPGPLDGTYPLPQTTGSGVALFDCDGDGRLDIYFLNNGGPKGRPNQLYLQREGRFVNASKGSGLDFAGYCMGAAVGNVNDDGRPDLLVTLVGSVRLFLNQGNGVFRDVTKESGLDNPAWGASAAFLDFDRDGRLDLVVVNYVDFDPSWRCSLCGKLDYCSPNAFPPTVSRLFRNVGEKDGVPRFQDLTASSGFGKVPGPGLGVYCADFDGDGWTDIFVANDGKPNHLWINKKNGTFSEEAVPRGLAYDAMGRAGGHGRGVRRRGRRRTARRVRHPSDRGAAHPLEAGAARLVQRSFGAGPAEFARLAQHRLRHGAARHRQRRLARPGDRQRPSGAVPPSALRRWANIGGLTANAIRCSPTTVRGGSRTSRRAIPPCAVGPMWCAAWRSATLTATADWISC